LNSDEVLFSNLTYELSYSLWCIDQFIFSHIGKNQSDVGLINLSEKTIGPLREFPIKPASKHRSVNIYQSHETNVVVPQTVDSRFQPKQKATLPGRFS
jgi:hypothetical protein